MRVAERVDQRICRRADRRQIGVDAGDDLLAVNRGHRPWRRRDAAAGAGEERHDGGDGGSGHQFEAAAGADVAVGPKPAATQMSDASAPLGPALVSAALTFAATFGSAAIAAPRLTLALTIGQLTWASAWASCVVLAMIVALSWISEVLTVPIAVAVVAALVRELLRLRGRAAGEARREPEHAQESEFLHIEISSMRGAPEAGRRAETTSRPESSAARSAA